MTAPNITVVGDSDQFAISGDRHGPEISHVSIVSLFLGIDSLIPTLPLADFFAAGKNAEGSNLTR